MPSALFNRRVRVLGEGSHGAVSVAKNKLTAQEVAVKHLATDKESPTQHPINEMKILLKLDHPHICKLLEIYESPSQLSLAMEVCVGNELYTALAERICYSPNVTKRLARQMFDAIAYLHANHICHRDLKLENWVYSDRTRTQIKLIDFGFSTEFVPGVPMTARHGTVYYVAPEVLKNSYNEKCDVWGLGVILFMLLSGQPPFQGEEDKHILRKISKGSFSFKGQQWRAISSSAKEFIRSLLAVKPEERLSAEEALLHEWLQPVITTPKNNQTTVDVSMLQRMRWFSRQSGLKKLVFGMLAYSLPNHELDSYNLKKQFEFLQNSDYNLTAEKLSNVLRIHLNIMEDEANEIAEAVAQGKATITYTDIIATHLGELVKNESRVKDVFGKLDVYRTGLITGESLKFLIGEEYCNRNVSVLMAEMNTTSIDYETFRAEIMGIDMPRRNSLPTTPIWKDAGRVIKLSPRSVTKVACRA